MRNLNKDLMKPAASFCDEEEREEKKLVPYLLLSLLPLLQLLLHFTPTDALLW